MATNDCDHWYNPGSTAVVGNERAPVAQCADDLFLSLAQVHNQQHHAFWSGQEALEGGGMAGVVFILTCKVVQDYRATLFAPNVDWFDTSCV